jgi:thiamine biosynthesis lipoprotein
MRHAEHVMGTVFSFDLRDPRPHDDALADCIAWLHWVDATFSTYRDNSEISRLRRGEIRITECSPEVAWVLDLCAQASLRTDGYFSAMPSGQLDPSGLVKGWSVEQVSQRLERAGSRRHCVNGGGDVRVVGGASPDDPWQIGVAHPLHPGELATVVSIRDGAVATSGIAERGTHIVDPMTGRPATELASVTIVGPDLTWADVYATAALARGHGARSWVGTFSDLQALAVAADGSAWWTPGFPAYGVVPHSPLSGNGQQAVSNLIEG